MVTGDYAFSHLFISHTPKTYYFCHKINNKIFLNIGKYIPSNRNNCSVSLWRKWRHFKFLLSGCEIMCKTHITCGTWSWRNQPGIYYGSIAVRDSLVIREMGMKLAFQGWQYLMRYWVCELCWAGSYLSPVSAGPGPCQKFGGWWGSSHLCHGISPDSWEVGAILSCIMPCLMGPAPS